MRFRSVRWLREGSVGSAEWPDVRDDGSEETSDVCSSAMVTEANDTCAMKVEVAF